jgi:hypothetical protein
MEKAGEKAKSFVVHALFVIMVAIGLYFIATSSVNLTGYVVLDASTAKAKLESALSSSALFSQITQSSICVVINDPEQPLSLQAVKSSTGWEVSEMVGYCSGLREEDVVVQFPDYDSFSKIVDNPSPRNIANGARDRDFEILESRYVELGGNVVCDSMFKAKYCTALETMATPEQLIESDLVCCIDEITRSQKKLLEQHLQEGAFEDETGVLEQPSGIAGLSMTTSVIILVVIVIVVLGIGVGVVMSRGKPKAAAGKAGAAAGGALGGAAPGIPTVPGAGAVPPVESPEVTQLRNYVTQVIGQGYTAEEIKTHLLEIGWDQATADKVLAEAQARVQQRQ